ncbi:MAG: hypothetical protein JWL77_4462 [Chthonomonadaceae bacterium]|nr:hypothetical protein [Chthonomonadaceae bacterium]
MEEKSATQNKERTGRRAWIGAVAVAATALLFWTRHPGADSGHSRSLAPAESEQQARERPDDPGALLQWGETLVQAKRWEEAAPVLTHAHALAPNDARPYAWLGIVAIEEHRDSEARDLLKQALQHDPNNATAIRALANLDARMRRLRPAIQGFERLTQLRPNDADAWQRLGLLLIGAGENYRSLDALARSAALEPNDLITEGALGNMALQAGRFDEADRAFRKVLERESENPQALTGLAKVRMRSDPTPAGLTAAEQLAEKALQAEPSLEAYKARGQIRMAQRRFAAAIQDFNACIRLDPRSREPYVLLSQCYASSGRPDLARKASAEFERLRARQLAEDKGAAHSPEATQ